MESLQILENHLTARLSPRQIDPEQIKGYKYPIKEMKFSTKDLILYALGIGFAQNPLKSQHMKFVYERDPKFQGFPTIAVLGANSRNEIYDEKHITGLPNFHPMNFQYAEQTIEFFKPIKPNEKYTFQRKLNDVGDKGKGILLAKETKCIDNQGELVALINQTLFIKGLGGFHFDGAKTQNFPLLMMIQQMPETQPQIRLSFKLPENLSLFYRLNGEWGTQHVDPDLARIRNGTTAKPTYHSQCIFGIMSRIIVDSYCDGEPLGMKKMACRFATPIRISETIIVKMWLQNNRVIFEVIIKERKKLAIKGYCELRDKEPKL